MKLLVGICDGCGAETLLRRFWRRGTVRWHDLIGGGGSAGVFRCPGSGQYPRGGAR